jgi:hypothetical protein
MIRTEDGGRSEKVSLRSRGKHKQSHPQDQDNYQHSDSIRNDGRERRIAESMEWRQLPKWLDHLVSQSWHGYKSKHDRQRPTYARGAQV